ncbi:MAG: zinc-ribbon domain-containing protein [Gammaproteobacteria bacterium]|nr:zinc-ribbon domain-containing protein [Gammaproteobacteria bacterium]
MQTRCPHCESVFRVSDPLLLQANGQVRCGQCLETFNAEAHLLTEEVIDTPSQYTAEQLRRLLQGKAKIRNPWFNIAWFSASFMLLLALLLQVSWAERATLANDPRFGTYINEFCAQWNNLCRLPEKRDLSALQLVSRNVYSHPNAPNALIITAVFTNTANFVQTYPTLRVSMSDIHGDVVAERYFKPAQYLNHVNDVALGMDIGKPIPITLEVQDPGQEALAFELDFL